MLALVPKCQLYARVYSYNPGNLFRHVVEQRKCISKFNTAIMAASRSQQPALMPMAKMAVIYMKTLLQPGLVYSLPVDVFGYGFACAGESWQGVELKTGLPAECVALAERVAADPEAAGALPHSSMQELRASIFFRVVNNNPERRTLLVTGIDEEKFGKVSIIKARGFAGASCAQCTFDSWEMLPITWDLRRLLKSVDITIVLQQLHAWQACNTPMLSLCSLPTKGAVTHSIAGVSTACLSESLSVFHAHGAVAQSSALVWDPLTCKLLDDDGRGVGTLSDAIRGELVVRGGLVEEPTEFGEKALYLNSGMVRWHGKPVFSDCKKVFCQPLTDLQSMGRASKLGVIMHLALMGWKSMSSKQLPMLEVGGDKVYQGDYRKSKWYFMALALHMDVFARLVPLGLPGIHHGMPENYYVGLLRLRSQEQIAQLLAISCDSSVKDSSFKKLCDDDAELIPMCDKDTSGCDGGDQCGSSGA